VKKCNEMNRSEEIKKINERAVVDHFFAWFAQHGGLEFAFSHLPEGEIPDLAYQAAGVELYVEHTSAHSGPEHRKFVNGPVRGSKNPAECSMGIGNIDELLGHSIVEAVQGKCDRMAYGPNTLLFSRGSSGADDGGGFRENALGEKFSSGHAFHRCVCSWPIPLCW
jgi:hypothetical protein